MGRFCCVANGERFHSSLAIFGKYDHHFPACPANGWAPFKSSPQITAHVLATPVGAMILIASLNPPFICVLQIMLASAHYIVGSCVHARVPANFARTRVFLELART